MAGTSNPPPLAARGALGYALSLARTASEPEEQAQVAERCGGRPTPACRLRSTCLAS